MSKPIDANRTDRRIIFAGGGTAGHVEPALAVARKWREISPMDECIFIGTSAGLEHSLVPQAGFDLKLIDKVVLPRNISLALLTLPWRLIKTVRSARKIIQGADLLIGFGGYVSAPAYLSARLLGVPFIIHEANAKVGWANRLGSFFTKNLAVAHKVSTGKFARATVTGLPLRRDVLAASLRAPSDWNRARRDAKVKMAWDPDRPTLLVLGGSQGSIFINDEISTALPTLVGQGIQIVHSVGGKNLLPPRSNNYSAMSYLDDMASAYLAADVVIARSGAVTCAEFGALGRFAIFIPLATGNGEQARNADFLVSAGRGMVVSQAQFSAEWLINNIHSLFEKSASTSLSGLTNDLGAVDKIVGMMSSIIKSGAE